MNLRVATCAAMLAVLIVAASSPAVDALPRYKLKVGQEIQYQSVSDDKALRSNSTSHEETTLTLWVVGHNDDGSWQIVERDASRETETNDGHEGPPSQYEELFSFDVFPEGRVVPDEAKGIARHSLFVFPRLPLDAAAKNWRTDYPSGRTEFAMLAGQTTAKELVFHYEEHTLHNEIYRASHAGTIHFDPERGLLVAETGESSMDYGFHVKTTRSIILKSVEVKGPAFVEQLSRESHAYRKAMEDYSRAEAAADQNGSQGEAIMKRAGEALRRARSQITLRMFAAQLDRTLARQDHVVEYFKREALHIAGLLDKPAAGWTLKDLDGQSHSLVDYRGRVVILDFWYRGCGWCTKAMPEMKKVADDFKNDPVVVLGINRDPDVSDARFVADRMHLNYTTLLGTEVAAKYEVHAFPTVILIDPAGIVRSVRSGYSPHLREQLDQAVRKLLPRKGSASQTPHNE